MKIDASLEICHGISKANKPYTYVSVILAGTEIHRWFPNQLEVKVLEFLSGEQELDLGGE